MSRASSIYVIMIAAGIAGLWGVLSVGANLSAPTNLAGRWEIVRSPEGPSAATGVQPGAIEIEQSGHFLRLHLQGGRTVDLKLQADGGRGDGTAPTLQATGGDSKLTVAFQSTKPAKDDKDAKNDADVQLADFTLSGPSPARFVARRARSTNHQPPRPNSSSSTPTTRPS